MSAPLARRAPWDELEATRAAIQVFLLVTHARNALLHMPDDIRALSKPMGASGGALSAGTALRVRLAHAQLVSFTLHLAGKPPVTVNCGREDLVVVSQTSANPRCRW